MAWNSRKFNRPSPSRSNSWSISEICLRPGSWLLQRLLLPPLELPPSTAMYKSRASTDPLVWRSKSSKTSAILPLSQYTSDGSSEANKTV
eukprot:CAMPEP_0115460566 /NCGR_PEP_ID=MMETSP0271-20121206/46850_1 /TAXON_ID=71861 /ORGANISM="Scrippsiella trochoidea, Strain CCMP3099" /LENGTH=89 /DNA_ID=CAMNT_0002887277 /DNA_START=235 /DNA_END=504 /DNA_ORIENTATION=-